MRGIRILSRAMSSQSEVLRVKKLSERAILPVRGSEFAAGYDLSSAEDTVIPARGKGLVKTDLAIAVPENTYARVAPRSGLALKKFIDTGAGVIDYDYRGNVGVVLFNHSDEEFPVQHGDRIAQLILERISMAPLEEVDALPETQRGEGGFGSTGVSNGGAVADHTVKKQRSVDASDLVLFLHEVELNYDASAMKQLKKMALEKDERFVAAYSEYQVTKNKDVLNETLNIVLGM